MELLLQKGARPNVLGLEGNTPLHHAALEGHYKVRGAARPRRLRGGRDSVGQCALADPKDRTVPARLLGARRVPFNVPISVCACARVRACVCERARNCVHVRVRACACVTEFARPRAQRRARFCGRARASGPPGSLGRPALRAGRAPTATQPGPPTRRHSRSRGHRTATFPLAGRDSDGRESAPVLVGAQRPGGAQGGVGVGGFGAAGSGAGLDASAFRSRG